MKKRAKQLAMLGLTVTMMCGTQMTAFASSLGEEASVAIETEAKETAKEETNKVVDVKGELTSVKFDREVNGVITLTDKDFNEYGLAIIDYILYGTKQSGGTDMPIYFDITSKGDFGLLNPQDIDDMGEYNGSVGVYKPDLEEAGGTKTYTGTFIMEDTEADGIDDTLDFSITVKYEKGNEGGGTVTPEPEKPQPEPEKDGWIKTEEGWKYYENGQKVTGWKAVSEKWYYFNEDGIMATSWVSIGGHWYYLNSSGAMETGWTSVGGHWYYLNADGTMATGWVSVGGHWYYLNADGTMATGWISVGGHWYYLNADGSIETGWVSVGGHWYYLNTDGTMATGWASVGGHWYYLNTDGTMASNQWIDGWYVDASGKML